MNPHENNDRLETFEHAVTRHRARLKATGKSKRGLELVAKFMARADVERGHVAAPVATR